MTPMNAILARCSSKNYAAISSEMTEISLSTNKVLYEAGDCVEQIYFPSTAVLSVVTLMRDGRAVENSTVGNESIVGVLSAFSREPIRSRVFVQVPGSGYRLPARKLLEICRDNADLLRVLYSAIQANQDQMEQSVACNALHEVPSRLSRWLLMTRDRVGSAEFPLTQEHLSIMLGVQRTTVTSAAQHLRKLGCISYRRGLMTIIDSEKLLAQACECYASLKAVSREI